MVKTTLRGLGVVIGVMVIFGCATTEDVKVRNYVEVKDRVDQNMEEGNAGFLAGTPSPEDRSNIRKTRKVYVLEVSKGEDPDGMIAVEDSGTNDYVTKQDYRMNESAYESDNTINVSRDDSDYLRPKGRLEEESLGTGQNQAAGSFVEYTIQKDDTLQKISKKFYDSYSKWPKIHDANKDVITDPNRIKPGIVIQIPME